MADKDPDKDFIRTPDDVDLEEHPDKEARMMELEQKAKNMTRFAVALGVIALVCMAFIVGILINVSIDNDTPDDLDGPLYCGKAPKEFKSSRDRLGDPPNPGVFHSLTVSEILLVREYFETEWNFTRPSDQTNLTDARIYTMDIELPNKADVLNYLDNGGPKPDRYARVVIFRGDLSPSVVEERICGPLHNITDCSVDVTVPFSVRPLDHKEYSYMMRHLIKEINRQFGTVLRESFGGSFDYDDCDEDCLNWMQTFVGSNIEGESPYRRKIWLTPHFDFVYYGLHPIAIGFLCDVDGVDEYAFSVEKVWYNGRIFDSPAEFITAYNAGTVDKIRNPLPSAQETTFSNMKTRGTAEERQKNHQRPPQLIEPDGKRYSINFGRVHYMGLWSFHYRISPMTGPAIYDVRFQGERIAYEISLQELVVKYSAANPMMSQSSPVTSALGLGSGSKALVSGSDCPTTATHLRYVGVAPDEYRPRVYHQAICVFERNSGEPLRRHHSFTGDEGYFYAGMLDSSLVVRSIHTVDNYDYVIDFTFHQNGALGVKVTTTGIVTASYYYGPQEQPYGQKVAGNIFGPVNFHTAHFKVDLDINGETNRYEAHTIVEESVPVLQAPSRPLSQVSITRSVKTSENDATYRNDFKTPTQHIFFNDPSRNEYGSRRAYRLSNQGASPWLTTSSSGNGRAFAWAQYQMAVTRRKETERRSSSPYNQMETTSPHVDFTSFINNENIVDEDLVAWVTLSSYSVPTSDDIPGITSPSREQAFYLTPHNYFDEDPSMESPDSVYISYVDLYDPAQGLVMDFQGSGDITNRANYGTCQYRPRNISDFFARDPGRIFES